MRRVGRLMPVIVTLVLAGLAAPAATAAETVVECGLFRDYTPPDPAGPTPGSITFGLSGSPETIAPDATLVPPTDTNLTDLAGGAPTGLTVVRDAGAITSLAFTNACTLSGSVTFVADLFGAGVDGYVVADRLVVPVELLEINDGLTALIPTAAANESPLSIAFDLDLATGTPTLIEAHSTLTGVVTVESDGDVLVGDARLPSSVIGDEARALLHEAADLGVEASVEVTGHGMPDDGSPGGVAMAISLEVTFQRPSAPARPTANPVESLPDTAAASRSVSAGAWPTVFSLLALSGIALSGIAVVWCGQRRPAP